MPDRRPPSHWLNAAPRSKSSKPKTPRSPRKRRTSRSGEDLTTLYWIAGGLGAVLLGLVAVYFNADSIRAWVLPPDHTHDHNTLAQERIPSPITPQVAHPVAPPPPEPLPVYAPAPEAPVVPPPPAVVQQPPLTLKEKA